MVHWTCSTPVGTQLIVHGPGSQLGEQLIPSGRSHWKLQLVPEQVITQSWTPVHPEWHS